MNMRMERFRLWLQMRGSYDEVGVGKNANEQGLKLLCASRTELISTRET